MSLCPKHREVVPGCELCAAHPREIFPDWDEKAAAYERRQAVGLGLGGLMLPDEPVRRVDPAPSIDNVELVDRGGPDVAVRLSYPRNSPRTHIEIELSEVRAADSIRVHYDFARDGWAIEQASTFEWSGDDPVCDPDWQEVAFVKAWARKPEPPGS